MIFASIISGLLATVLNFNTDWEYSVAASSNEWEKATLPHCYSWNRIFKSHASDQGDCNGYRDFMYYRKSFTITDLDKRYILEFESFRQAIYVYVNDEYVGCYEAGVVPCGFDITDSIVEGENTVFVKLDSRSGRGGMKDYLTYQWNTNDFNPTLAGLTGNVKLHVKPRENYITLPLYENLGTKGVYIWYDGEVHVEAEIHGSGEIVWEIQGTGSNDQGAIKEWSPDHPYLYDVKVQLKVDDEIVDEEVIRTGFRRVGYDPKRGILINDEPVWLTGYAQRSTDEWAAIGWGNDWLYDYDAKLIRESGANFVRWMHVAPKPSPVRSCDKFGIVCVCPAGDKESDVEGEKWTQREEAMRDAIIYFRNSPSILFWEAGNNQITGDHMASMRAIKDELDSHGGRLIGCRSINTAEQLASAEYVGTMLNRHVANAYTTMQANGVYLPIIETEYAREESARRDVDGQIDFIKTNAKGYAEFYGNRVGGYEMPYYSACAALCWTDSIQHGRLPDTENARMSGRVDPTRIKKPSFSAYQVFQAREPKVKLLVGVTNGVCAVGSVHCAHLELEKDGVVISECWKPENIFIFDFTNSTAIVGYSTLSAVAYDKAMNEIARDTVYAPSTPAYLELNAVSESNLAFVDIALKDASGVIVDTATNRINFTSTSSMFMGGYNSGVFGDDSPIGQDWVNLERGINRVFVKATEDSATVTLTAECPSLGLTTNVVFALTNDTLAAMSPNIYDFSVTNTAEAVNDLGFTAYSDGTEPQYGLFVTNGESKVWLGNERFTGPVSIFGGELRLGTPADVRGCILDHDFGALGLGSAFTNEVTNCVAEVVTNSAYMNGRPCMVADYMQLVTTTNNYKAYSSFLACQSVNTAKYEQLFVDASESGAGASRWYIGRHNDYSYWELYQAGWKGTSLLFKNGEKDITINKQPFVLSITNRFSRAEAVKYRCGWGKKQAWGEVVLYNRTLETIERQGIEDYLMWKWGVRDVYTPIPDGTTIAMEDGVLDLGGFTVNAASFCGTGVVSNGVIVTSELVYEQGDGDLTLPAVDNATYYAYSSTRKLELTGVATNVTIVLPVGYLKHGSRATAIYCLGEPTFVDEEGLCEITSLGNGWWSLGGDNEPVEFTWIGGDAGEWKDPAMWYAAEAYGYPTEIDTAIVTNQNDFVEIDLDGETVVSNLYCATETILQNGTLKPHYVGGEGMLSLGTDTVLSDPGYNITIDADLFVGGTEANPSGIKILTEGTYITLNGALKGNGYLKVNSWYKKGKDNNPGGVHFNGDGSAFAGTVEVIGNSIPRNYTDFASTMSSSNSTWIVQTGSKGNFLQNGYKTYTFGSLSGSVNMYDQTARRGIIVETGFLNRDDVLGGNWFENYPNLVSSRGHTLKKFGTGTLSFTGTCLNAFEANAGVLSFDGVKALEWIGREVYCHVSSIKFGGGRVREAAANTFDISSIMVAAGGPLDFDDGGLDRAWTNQISSAFQNGFIKRGLGTLALLEKPAYTGSTEILEGAVDFVQGADIEELFLGDGAGLVLTNGVVTANSVTLEGAVTLVIDALPADGKIIALSNGFEQEANLTLVVGGVAVSGYTLVSKADGLYILTADSVRVGSRGFATLAGALKAAESGSTVVISKDLALSTQRCEVKGDITIDFGGCSASFTNSVWAFNVGTNALTVLNATIDCANYGFYVTDGLLSLSNSCVTASKRVAQVRGAGEVRIAEGTLLTTTGEDPAVFAVGSFEGSANVDCAGNLRSIEYPYSGHVDDSYGSTFELHGRTAKQREGWWTLVKEGVLWFIR